jgi:hypothetical protein
MKIYIAGKYSGLPHHAAIEKFAATEQQLITAGFQPKQIINPTKFVAEGTPWIDAMQICFKLLRTCDAIYIQRDWRDSFGAKQEITEAQRLRLEQCWEEMGDIEMIKNLISNNYENEN